MTRLQSLIAEAKVHAAKTGHVILIGLPIFADRRQAMQLLDTGSGRKSWKKWCEWANFKCAVFPDGRIMD